MRLAVVMTTYETPSALDRVLAGYALQSRRPEAVVVADDGSGASTRQVVQAWADRKLFEVHHVWQENAGYRRSRILNLGIAAVQADYVVLTDGDCLPHRDFVADHAQLAEPGFWVQGKRAQIRQAHADEARPEDAEAMGLLRRGWLWRSVYGVRWPVPLVWRQTGALRERALGSNMGLWREDLVAVNGFNEAFVGWGSEDRELSVRLHRLGRRKKFVIGRALQFHLHPATSRARTADNGDLLAEVRASGGVRCAQGLSAHLGASAGAGAGLLNSSA
jgi:glycosyltransferase involved in cell wall biosynthesis